MIVEERVPVTEGFVTVAAGAAAAIGIAGLLFVSAQVRIPVPWTPVPITLQTLVVLLGAAWIGSGRTLGGIFLYAGAAGLGAPVLSGWQGGLSALTGATAGYVVGWTVAAYLIGALLHGRRSSTTRAATTFVAAEAVIFVCGILHLTLLLRLPLEQALWMGLWPFVPGDLAKVIVATAAYRMWPAPTAGDDAVRA